MIYIFDIDGVLADNSKTKHLDCTDPVQRAKFNEMVPDLPPIKNTLRLLKNLASRGKIYLFTARSAGIRVLTQNWLYDHKVPHEDLYMRPFGNDDKDEVLKKKMLLELAMQTGAEPQEMVAFDDKPQVRAMYERWGVSSWNF